MGNVHTVTVVVDDDTREAILELVNGNDPSTGVAFLQSDVRIVNACTFYAIHVRDLIADLGVVREALEGLALEVFRDDSGQGGESCGNCWSENRQYGGAKYIDCPPHIIAKVNHADLTSAFAALDSLGINYTADDFEEYGRHVQFGYGNWHESSPGECVHGR